tara:strand:+ start:1148 stop:1678 length:531 start_codon:yes stop_codon:yes gene_type:complete
MGEFEIKGKGSDKVILKEIVQTTVDMDTGEVVELSKTETFKGEREPDYIKMYISDIALLNDIPKGMNPILLDLIAQMGYNNIIPAYKPIKLMTCNRLGISLDYLNKAIQTFYEKGLLVRVARGVYMAEPNLFARGKWEDIKTLRLTIDYVNKDGKHPAKKKLNSNISKQVQLSLGI